MYTRTPFLLIFRLVLALVTTTFFQPDEFFQSLEVAHHAVFGYGYLTWEWTTEHPVRSPLYLSLYAGVYWILKALHLDGTGLLIHAPKIVNGLVAAIVDVCLIRLTRNVLGPQYESSAAIVSLTSMFHALSLSRSLSNSLETALTTLAFSYYTWDLKSPSPRRHLRLCIVFAALACLVRPTNAIIWVFAFGTLAKRLLDNQRMLLWFLLELALIGTLSLGALLCIDTFYFGQLTFTPWNFFMANLSISSYYGVNQWHYYITQALPILCTTALPFVIHGVYNMVQAPSLQERHRYQTLLGAIGFTIAVYSLGQHKEWRFIHPLLPLLHVCAAKSLADLKSPSPSNAEGHNTKVTKQGWLPIRPTHLALMLLNIPAILYVILLHGRAQISVMHYLRSLPPVDLQSVGFLMPCHSTPWQAYLHRPELASPKAMWALTCEPPLNIDEATYKDQTDIFYDDPVDYLLTRFPARVNTMFDPAFTLSSYSMSGAAHGDWKHEWPQNLVMFGALLEEPNVRQILMEKGYVQVWYGINGWEEDERRRGGVVVWKWGSSQ